MRRSPAAGPFDHGGPGRRLDIELEAGREAGPSQDPRRIFAKTLQSPAGRSQDPCLEACATAERIDAAPLGQLDGDRVDGEIPPLEILLQGELGISNSCFGPSGLLRNANHLVASVFRRRVSSSIQPSSGQISMIS